MNRNKQLEKSSLRTSTSVFEEDGRGSSAKIEADALFRGVLMLFHHPHIRILTAIFQLQCQRKRYVICLSSNLYISPVCFTSTISFPLCAHHVYSNNLRVQLWPHRLPESCSAIILLYRKFLRRNSPFHVLLSRELQRLLATTSVDELVQRQCKGGEKRSDTNQMSCKRDLLHRRSEREECSLHRNRTIR